MINQEPPNLRDVDNCAKCKYGQIEWDGDVKCLRYDYYSGRHRICDNYVMEIEE